MRHFIIDLKAYDWSDFGKRLHLYSGGSKLITFLRLNDTLIVYWPGNILMVLNKYNKVYIEK